MKGFYFLVCVSLLACDLDAQVIDGSNQPKVNASGNIVIKDVTEELPSNPIFVIADIGQSNSIGRASRERVILGSIFPEIPSLVKCYWKPDYTTTDNGNFYVFQHGAFMTKEPDQSGSVLSTGSYGQLATLLSGYTQDTTYIIPMGDGGTALQQNLTSPDWSPVSSGECFQIFTQRYFDVAYAKIQSRNPGRNIVTIICFHQGESDAMDNTATAAYSTNFSNFVTAIRGSNAAFASCLWVTTKIWYNSDSNEATVNSVFDAYALTHSNFKVIDISDQPKKIELTTDQKLGVSAASTGMSDDIHTSYLGQTAKAERYYSAILNYYGISQNSQEITDNTTYNPNVLTNTGFRLQCNRGNSTLNNFYSVSAFDNDLGTGTFSSVSGNVKFKVDLRRGWAFNVSAGNSRVLSTTAIGTTIFQGSGFSFGGWYKPRDGQFTTSQILVYDVQNYSSTNNSRFYGLIDTGGHVEFAVAVGGTVVRAVTANVIFGDGLQTDVKHIACTVTSGNFIRIYINGVLQTLDVTNNGDISAINLASYVNGTNAITLGARRVGASTFDLYYLGLYREVIAQKYIWSASDVLNIMSN